MDSSLHSSSAASSPTSYIGERSEHGAASNPASSANTSTSSTSSQNKVAGLPPSSTASAWDSIASRKPVSGAIGSERVVSASGANSYAANAPTSGTSTTNNVVSSGTATGQPANEWYPPLSRETPARSASSSAIASIGSGRRHGQASEANSVRSSRPTSPTPSISLSQSITTSPPSYPVTSFYSQQQQHQQNGPAMSSNSLTSPNAPSSANPEGNQSYHAQQQQNQQQQQAQSQVSGASVTSTPSELESAFDAMLRGSRLFQEILNRVDALENQVSHLSSHPGAHQPHLANGHFDITPTRSPSVAASATGNNSNFLSANSRPHSLLIPNHANSPSVVSTALHSPSLSQGHGEQAYGAPPTSSTTNVDRDVIRQLTAQLSTLGNNVAQLMAQQAPQTPGGLSTPGATPVSAVGNGGWPFEGHHPPSHGHGPQHPALGRPALSNMRAASYDIPRGAALPRASVAAAAAHFADERERKQRSHMGLQAPTPVGMGSRRHSTDVIENMHNVAEGMPGAGPPGGPPGLGSQSLLGKWEALGVSGELLRAIIKYGIGPPSKIQMKAIPCVLNNQDIVAQASSIQERIQCYVIPALQHVYVNIAQAAMSNMNEGTSDGAPKGIQALILTATIDQAGQAHRMCLGLGQALGITSSLAVGQGDISSELATLSANPPHILVGTPQKLLDLLAIRSIPVDRLSLLVIDEMDQLIARNLSDYVNNLAKLLPPPISSPSTSRDRSPAPGSGGMKSFDVGSPTRPSQERQTAIFSCTVPQEVLNFASALNLREPVRVLVRRENNQEAASPQTPSLRGMKHYFLYLAMNNGNPNRGPGGGRQELSGPNREWKLEALADLCSDADFTQGVVYCSSIESVEAVSYRLASRNIDALALHSDMGSSARHAVISKFRSGNVGGNRGISMKRVLIVLDALCRTLSDIHQVALVVNFDLPRAVEDYVHRAACAASSGYGRAGSSVNIVSSPADIDMLRAIESFYRLKINELPPVLSNIC